MLLFSKSPSDRFGVLVVKETLRFFSCLSVSPSLVLYSALAAVKEILCWGVSASDELFQGELND